MGHHIIVNPQEQETTFRSACQIIQIDTLWHYDSPCTHNRAHLTGWDRRVTKCHAEFVPPHPKHPFPSWRAARLLFNAALKFNRCIDIIQYSISMTTWYDMYISTYMYIYIYISNCISINLSTPWYHVMFLPRLLQSLQLLQLSEMVPSQMAGWRYHRCERHWQQAQLQGNDQMEQHDSTLQDFTIHKSLWNWGPSTSIFNAVTVIRIRPCIASTSCGD